MICITCNKSDHDEDAKYCNYCGTNLIDPRVCECGNTRIREKANYCNQCGVKLE